jgi:hypothetical protein
LLVANADKLFDQVKVVLEAAASDNASADAQAAGSLSLQK